MLDFFASIIPASGIDLKTYLICTAIAFACGLLAAFAASRKTHISKSFLISLIILPPVVETVILMVNGNVGTGVAVAGAFSLVRFRSVPGKAREIAAIFLSMTAGLACAAGYIGIALIFSVLVCAAIMVIAYIPVRAEREMDLRITIPETLNFTGAFDDIFAEYAGNTHLVSVKTTNMGSLYKLLYRIELKDRAKTKEFIDALRTRNGNLEISITESAERSEEL